MTIEDMLKEIPVLETDRLLLRKIILTDVDDIFEFSSDPEVAYHMTWEANRSRQETLTNFLKPVIKGYDSGSSAEWAVVHKESGKVIGTCSLIDWSNEHHKAEIAYVLNRQYWGSGFTTEAGNEVIKYGFNTLQLNRMEGRCDIDNPGSEKVMLKLGMQYEGLLRKNEFIKGTFRDTKIFSLLNDDF
ncbi:ribosomal-protein-alanine N-acetyltransferase [Sinobaca qinghaiensis]|uniref:Ribosomal-protein-alanine N-acetyltransferase n=1 Tax=Sinobaca qinghaiensis TaxID=342944 RepID=A0A419UWP2_9BACL|nr:GNAT family protein [Sinobaca qinghaiensis]RKD69549.1 ribosomal-protein-alanine N-acetyltransferase [Sinobaca qinghaiensis]